MARGSRLRYCVKARTLNCPLFSGLRTMIIKAMLSAVTALLLSQPASAAAKQDSGERSVATSLSTCRSIAASANRLACYDGAVAAFEAAQANGEIAVVDRKAVNTARNRLFGLDGGAFPNLFGGGDAEDLEEIETTLVRAVQSSDGSWTFSLENGTVWRQIDSYNSYIRSQPGQAVRIRRAALGSYLMNVGNSRALRVKRQ
jgi:hypothetical protein